MMIESCAGSPTVLESREPTDSSSAKPAAKYGTMVRPGEAWSWK